MALGPGLVHLLFLVSCGVTGGPVAALAIIIAHWVALGPCKPEAIKSWMTFGFLNLTALAASFLGGNCLPVFTDWGGFF